MTQNLIDLDDDSAPSMSTVNGLSRNMTPTNKSPKPAHHDSFSDLAGMMRAKKLYTPISTPAPPSQPLAVAPNGPRFASRNQHGSSILSPSARPFQPPESVASFLQEQELAAPTPVAPEPIPEYRPENTRLLEIMAEESTDYSSDDDSGCDHHCRRRSPSPPYMQPLLISGLELPAGVGPTHPPTPTESLRNSPSAFRSDQEAVVRVTKQTWDSLGKKLDTIKKRNLELESQLSAVEFGMSNAVFRDIDHDIGKAAMGRSLSEKEMKIKTQQLEIDELTARVKTAEVELDKVVRQLAGAKAKLTEMNPNTGSGDLTYLRSMKHERPLSDLAAKDRELEDLKKKLGDQERTIDKVTRERNEAVSAQVNPSDDRNRARSLAETLAQREKLITDLRHQIVTEQLKVVGLEDDLEAAQAKINQAEIDDIKSRLREKTSVCDRQRNQLKETEAELKLSQARVMKITKQGESLRGAAHVVKPAEASKLPKLVISCVECYNKNLPCDNGAKCRNCIENNTQCARWRCSVKHKYGDCSAKPCPLSHDSQGWLVLRTERPEW